MPSDGSAGQMCVYHDSGPYHFDLGGSQKSLPSKIAFLKKQRYED